MAPIAGLGEGSDPVKLVADADLTRVQLSAQEGFVLSRVDGSTPVDMICELTGLGKDNTIELLKGLRQKGLVTIGDEAPVAQEPEVKEATGPLGIPTAEETAEESALLDADEAQGINLRRDIRLLARRFHSQLGQLNFFDLLEVSLDASEREIRRAYFKRSKQFHPDRYFNKTLGPYKEMLEEVFRQVGLAYEFLQDAQKRDAYRATVLTQAEQVAAARRVAHNASKASSTSSAAAKPEAKKPEPKPAPTEEEQSPSVAASADALLAAYLQGDDVSVPIQVDQNEPKASVSSDKENASGEFDEGPPTALMEDDERAARRRAQRKRRRRMSVSHPLMVKKKKARRFFDQGVKQLEEGKSLAAAASLKLALTFDPEDPEIQAAHDQAVAASAHIAAENAFKRAMFEESVGRFETAGKYYQEAANAQPRYTYLHKAAKYAHMQGNLQDAKRFAEAAVHSESVQPEVRLLLAGILLEAGMLKNARRQVDEVLKTEPKNKEARDLLKRIKRGG